MIVITNLVCADPDKHSRRKKNNPFKIAENWKTVKLNDAQGLLYELLLIICSCANYNRNIFYHLNLQLETITRSSADHRDPRGKPLGTDGLTRGYSEPAWLTTPRVHSFIADAVSVSSSVRSFKNQPSQSNRFSPHLRFQPGTGPKSLSLPLRDISSSHSRNTDNARAVASLPQLVIAAFFLMRSRNLADCLRANPASVIEVFVGTGTLSRGSSL